MKSNHLTPPSSSHNPFELGNSSHKSDTSLRSMRRSVGDFEPLPRGLLGQGSFGVVEKVKDTADGKIYAMKSISKQSLNHKEAHIANLKQEIRIHKYLLHPYITKLHYFFEDAQQVYLVMSFAENGRPDLLRQFG